MNEEYAPRPSWDDYFLGIAKAVAARADCRRAQYGAVIVKDSRVISTGYNGTPAGGLSCLAGQCPRGLLSSAELPHGTEDHSNCISLHAETNAIAYADHRETQHGVLYLYGPGHPCDMCSKLIKAAGIDKVVWSGDR